MKKGDSGAQVAQLQHELNQMAERLPESLLKIAVDGSFGPATDRAVRSAQHFFGLVEDGIAGPRTVASLGAFLESPLGSPHFGEEGPASHAHPAKTRAEAIERYGEIKDGRWANEGQWMTDVTVPEALRATWLADGKTHFSRIRCNADMALPLERALKNVVDRGLTEQLKTFDGCWNIRNVRGSSNKLSAHAYGLALDINCDTNQLGTQGDMSAELGACFTDEGFSWGKNFKSRKDPMHFSFCFE